MKYLNIYHKRLIILIVLLPIIVTCQSQKLKHRMPAPAFEVTGSIYPWEVHDEGISLILDNMTSIAGVNSVYLIAVMHEEHRPFNGDNLPGVFTFIHNPVRSEWDAEDSRAYFKPDMNSYGAIKPMFSKYAWLQSRDYLKIVLDSAHARGLRAGVEVSHTYIPNEILNGHPEYKQMDIDGNPMDRPCPNNPAVREYLLALYTDLAKNYPVDYVQTCMLLFSRSDDPRNGTCFCNACKHKARDLGFDIEKARHLLKDNPYAQPELDQWLKFRRYCTTEIYKLVTDRIHSINNDIDFRLNDLNDRSSGLMLEELKGNINSVHLSTHTEQRGYQKSDRQSRISTTQYFMGKNIPIIPGIPTRLLTTPAIIESSIKISVNGGAKGIGIKHYDGSPYSGLRAVRNGLSNAGIPGFTNILGIEAEDMNLEGYSKNKYLLESCIETAGTGIATGNFDYEEGIYDIIVSYADEKDGQGSITLLVNGTRKASWKLDEDINCWRRKTISNIQLKKGDEIKIIGKADGIEYARVDFVEFVPNVKANRR